MNIRLLTRTTCFNKIEAFGHSKAAALTETASDSKGRKRAKAKARAKFAELTALIAIISQEIAKQMGSGRSASTTSRGVLRDALNGDLREWNRTAAALAEELNRPEIIEGFRTPSGGTDLALAGRARSFIKAVAAMDLHDAFIEHGLEDDFEDALEERIADFEASQSAQSVAGQESSGATDALDDLVRDGMSIRKVLDALVHNLFKGSAAVIGEWAAASHVERPGARKAQPLPAVLSVPAL